MENKKLIGLSITLLVAFLGSIGYNIMDNTYYCEERGIVIVCPRFSTSGNRCYPSLTSNLGYRDCKEGWIKVEGEIQIDTDRPQIVTDRGQIVTKGYLCDQYKCEEVVR